MHYSDFFAMKDGLPVRFLARASVRSTGKIKQFTFLFMQNLPTEDAIGKFAAEMREKGVYAHLIGLKVAQSGSSFSTGYLQEHTYQLFKLWNSFPVNGKTIYAFLNITEPKPPTEAKKIKTEDRKTTWNLRGGPALKPARV